MRVISATLNRFVKSFTVQGKCGAVFKQTVNGRDQGKYKNRHLDDPNEATAGRKTVTSTSGSGGVIEETAGFTVSERDACRVAGDHVVRDAAGTNS